MQVTIDKSSVAGIRKVLNDLGANINKELAVAVNKTTVQSRTSAARKMRESIPVPVKVLKKAVFQRKRATAANPVSGLNLFGGYPIPLKYFKPRQRAGGVSYQAGAKDKSHGYRPHAFIIQKFGQRVFTRKTTKRGPLEEQKGMSPGSASGAVADAAMATAKEKLPIQTQARIRFLTLKARGQLKGNQKR